MRFLTVFCAISTLLPAIFAGPTPLSVGVPIERYPGQKVDGGYIVRLKEGTSVEEVIGKIISLLTTVTHKYECAFNGFAGKFDSATLAALQILPGVASIAEDGIVRTTVTQTDAPWGLSRLSSKSPPGSSADVSALSYPYSYKSEAGEGVDIYIIDTGIRVSHHDFGGRAKWAYTAPGIKAQSLLAMENETDGNGHGTHCAGTAAGTQYGVAKKANLYAVKVLSDEGSGTTSDVIAGMNYVCLQKRDGRRPTVASMSLGGGGDNSLDSAAKSLVKAGVHLVVAAGNSNEDAKDTSPARVTEAITVGASDINDARAPFSNWGSGVDVFAPGVRVTSTWIANDTATFVASGTSMATPHVAGLVAYLLSVGDSKMSPAKMSEKIKELALKDVFHELPAGTPNLLANNGV